MAALRALLLATAVVHHSAGTAATLEPAEALAALAEDGKCDGLTCGASFRQLRGWQVQQGTQGQRLGTRPCETGAGAASAAAAGGDSQRQRHDSSSSSGGPAAEAQQQRLQLLQPEAGSGSSSGDSSHNGTTSRDATAAAANVANRATSLTSDDDDAGNGTGGDVDDNDDGHSQTDTHITGTIDGPTTSNASSNATGLGPTSQANATANASSSESNAIHEVPLWTNPQLLHHSTAPLHTFYMYRAVSDEVYPPLNVNTGSLAGVLWYLHHEVVHHVGRKFGITKIIRLRVQTRATQPLFEKGMNFGVRLAFDYGQATGPFQCGRQGENFSLCGSAVNDTFDLGAHADSHAGAVEWDTYGYFVGCNELGSFPFPMEPSNYPGAIWYSLPGPCPNTPWPEHDAECTAHQPGGYCKGTPTGQGNCTWTYEEAGEISLDELVGIPDYYAFLGTGRREYDKFTDRGRGFTWWDSFGDALANEWRVWKAEELFAKRYPNMSALPTPRCDFNYDGFYRDPGFYREDCHTTKPGEACFEHVAYAKHHGLRQHPEWYPGLSFASSFHDFQAFLYRTGRTLGSCPPPCADLDCHTAVYGELCWADVQYAMHDGIHAHPEWYPGLKPGDSFEDFQRYLFESGQAACPEPCPAW